jgi:phenylacetate-coenzyme A ligase PaaK-like adenylate-forming protein
MMTGLFSKIYGNTAVLRNLYGQRRIPYRPLEELYKLRDKRLKDIVRYAAETVPYYQDLFRTMKINPPEIQSVENLNEIHFNDKEMIRNEMRLTRCDYYSIIP